MTNAEPDRISIRRRITATREELFDAWTDPDSLGEWMCPGDIRSAEVVQLEARPGGRFLILLHGAAQTFRHSGEFHVVERPSRLVMTWISEATRELQTLVTVEFIEVSPDVTDLLLTHEGIPDPAVVEQYRGGWGQILDRMEARLPRRA
jgi:uncharacterized protein YndB with AHSA1/START domain